MSLTEKLKKHYKPAWFMGIIFAYTFFTVGLSAPLLAYPQGCPVPNTSYSYHLEAWKCAAKGNNIKKYFIAYPFSALTYPGVLVGAYYRNSTIDNKLCEENQGKLEEKLSN